MNVAIEEIKIPQRLRKQLGDLSELKLSMNILGQLQPIGITQQYDLVFGERRLRAAQALGWEMVDAIFIE